MTDEAQSVRITHLPGINHIIISKKNPTDSFFYSNDTKFVIPVVRLSQLLSHMVRAGFVSPKVLEGILEEYYSSGS